MNPWPWTDDPILRVHKFTNVFRELDRGTVWCREWIREPYADDPELFFNIATYRRYNWIDTAAELGYIHQYDPDRYNGLMMRRQARGEQIFTGAHMICGTIRDPETGEIPYSKVEQVFRISFKLLWDNRHEMTLYLEEGGHTLEQAFNRMMGLPYPGYGAFVCYEVVSDLRWTRYLKDAPDVLSWANPGPGAKRGIIRLYGYSPKGEGNPRFSNKDYIQAMQYLLYISPRYLQDHVPDLEMRDVEHSLCEWDKYTRVLKGEGKTRSKYNPPKWAIGKQV